MEKKTRAAVYARVSTAAQDPEPQLGSLRKFVTDCDWSLFGEYSEQASGAEDDRPQLARLMNDAFDRKFDAVVVWKFDRFGRSVGQLIRSLEQFQELGNQFVSVQETLGTGSPMGKACFTFLSALAEFERSMIRERVSLGMAAARAAGKPLGRPARNLDEERIRSDYRLVNSVRKTAELHKCSRSIVSQILLRSRRVHR